MSDDFRKVISALWERLKLGAPSFGDTATINLSIDGLDVALSESADGRHLVVSGAVGRLAHDLHRQAEQVRHFLRTNLGLLQANKAGLRLDESTPGGAMVRVEAVYPYAAAQVEDLIRLIEDVLYRMELHTGDLATAAPPRGARLVPVEPVAEENVIFRP